MTNPSSPASALSWQFLAEGVDEALVAAFDSLMEAELARGRLEVEGIGARILNTSPMAVYAPTAHAAGGVKLWVAAENLEAARTVLFAPSALVEPMPADSEEVAPVVASADDLALRAFRAAVLGFIVVPPVLHVYSTVLLLRATLQEGELSPRARRQVVLSLLLDSLGFGLAGALAYALLR